jgi:hypothetical protein
VKLSRELGGIPPPPAADGEFAMTPIFNHQEKPESQISYYVVTFFMTVVLLLAGALPITMLSA